MKRRLSLLLMIVLLCVLPSAQADVPQISGSLFSSAKDALVCLASGEYERLVTLLPFSGVVPSATEWQSFAGNFSALGSGVQTEYAVAYWTGADWCLAVPVATPSSGDVEVMALISADGSTFSGYRYASWSQIQSEYQSASYVTWNEEYVDSEPVIAVD